MIQNIMRMNFILIIFCIIVHVIESSVPNRLSCQHLGLAVALLYSREFDADNCSYSEDIKIRNVMLHMEREGDTRLYN